MNPPCARSLFLLLASDVWCRMLTLLNRLTACTKMAATLLCWHMMPSLVAAEIDCGSSSAVGSAWPWLCDVLACSMVASIVMWGGVFCSKAAVPAKTDSTPVPQVRSFGRCFNKTGDGHERLAQCTHHVLIPV